MKIIECPRDAMQGIDQFIPTKDKIRYINQLLKVGFDTIDFGSFVSPKAIPQMRDTAEVLAALELDNSTTKLLAIVANLRGANDACEFDEIDYLGFPLSLSETFQQRNTNKSIADAIDSLKGIQDLCTKHDKTLVTYLSMGFGNPYGENWDIETVEEFVQILDEIGIKIIALSDTIGAAEPQTIHYIFNHLIPTFPHIEFGAHLHTIPDTSYVKIEAAIEAGCRRFDAAIKGFGGCPMAKDELTGNLDTIRLIDFFNRNQIQLEGFNTSAFNKSIEKATQIFPS
ncbi:MAG: hydroxymethylglutaryl-CoA lyase [Cytophagales bacterium]